MKILLLVAFGALAAADVSHLQAGGYSYQKPAEAYGSPVSSYGAPQSSVLTSFDGFGSVNQFSPDYFKAFANSQSAQLTLPSANQGASFQSAAFSNPSAGFQFSSPAPNVDVSNFQFSTPAPSAFQFSTPAPSADLSGFQFSTPAPSADLSAFQFSTPAPAVSSAGGVQFSTPAPSVAGVSVSDGQFSTPKPTFNFASSFGSASFPGADLSGSSFPSFGSAGFDSSFGQSVVGKTSGGSISDAFGVSAGGASQDTQVSKHLYFFAAPEEPEEEVKPRINLPAQQQAQKSYKIIFIKAPTYKSQLPINIPAPPPNEEKTLVYVLVKKPEAQATVNVQPSQPAKPSKPEVFFIKYKSQKEAEEAVEKLQSQYGVSVAPNYEQANALDSGAVHGDSGLTSAGLEVRNGVAGSSGASFGVAAAPLPEIKSFGLEGSSVISQQPDLSGLGVGGFVSSTPTPVTFGDNSADSFKYFGGGIGDLARFGLSDGGSGNLLQGKFGFNVGPVVSTEAPTVVESSSPAVVVSSTVGEAGAADEVSTEVPASDDASQNAVDNSEVGY